MASPAVCLLRVFPWPQTQKTLANSRVVSIQHYALLQFDKDMLNFHILTRIVSDLPPHSPLPCVQSIAMHELPILGMGDLPGES
eukprot:scaffold9938_cov70-Skeletonema_marinoi.AAC.1